MKNAASKSVIPSAICFVCYAYRDFPVLFADSRLVFFIGVIAFCAVINMFVYRTVKYIYSAYLQHIESKIGSLAVSQLWLSADK
jgi:hypothetical protein